MTFEQEQQLIGEIKTYIAENLPLSKMSDDDLNEKVEKELVEVESGLKSVGKTNESVEKVISVVKEKEANMEAIVMRIEELGKAIVSLQKLESVLSRIAPK